MRRECLGVEVRIEGDDCPLCEGVGAADVRVEAAPPLLRSDGNALLRFSAPASGSSDDHEGGLGERDDPSGSGGDGSEATGSDALARALDADERVRYLYRGRADGRDTYRCLSLQPCVVQDLVDVGFLVEALTYADGGARVRGAVVGQAVLEGVMARAGETVGVELERVYALGPDDDAPVARRWDLTPAQTEALATAVEMGYFTVPRGATASEVADALAISKTAFLERLHRGQHALLSAVFGIDPREE